jgi:hypothetical protein
LVVKLIHPDLAQPRITAQYTFQALPQNIKQRYKSITNFFQNIQVLNPEMFWLSNEGALQIKAH